MIPHVTPPEGARFVIRRWPAGGWELGYRDADGSHFTQVQTFMTADGAAEHALDLAREREHHVFLDEHGQAIKPDADDAAEPSVLDEAAATDASDSGDGWSGDPESKPARRGRRTTKSDE